MKDIFINMYSTCRKSGHTREFEKMLISSTFRYLYMMEYDKNNKKYHLRTDLTWETN